MANCHLGHNTVIGDHVIIANGTLLGGHCEVVIALLFQETAGAPIYANRNACLMQGSAGISKDLPLTPLPRCTIKCAGLNVVGMRRAGREQ
jgi:UDP-N-acetylglucosamine acyltransferase